MTDEPNPPSDPTKAGPPAGGPETPAGPSAGTPPAGESTPPAAGPSPTEPPPTPPPAAAGGSPPPTPAATPGAGPAVPPDQKEERMWAMLAHLSSLLGCIIPFANIIAPLVVWLIKKDTMPLVDDQGKEAVNFQITVTIGYLISVVLIFILIGLPLLFAILIFAIIFTIIAALKANEGVRYRYPLTIRFIS